ncbi:MAG: hypothetical protein ACFE9R_16570 [Candidatus Hermodarchaeota archaeon]
MIMKQKENATIIDMSNDEITTINIENESSELGFILDDKKEIIIKLPTEAYFALINAMKDVE